MRYTISYYYGVGDRVTRHVNVADSLSRAQDLAIVIRRKYRRHGPVTIWNEDRPVLGDDEIARLDPATLTE